MLIRFFKWIKDHSDLILRIILCIPILLSIIVSINHCITWFNIANPPQWAWFLSISVEISAMCSLTVLIVAKPGMHIYLPFILITMTQIIGNIFFSYDFIDENGILFKNWQTFKAILIGETSPVNNDKFWLAVIEGSIVPMLSLLSLHLIAKFEMKETKKQIFEEVRTSEYIIPEETKVEIQPVSEVKEEKVEIQKPKEVKKKKTPLPTIVASTKSSKKKSKAVLKEEPVEEIIEVIEEPIVQDIVEPEPVEEVVEESVEEAKTANKPLFYEEMGTPGFNSQYNNQPPRRGFLPRIRTKNSK